MLPHPLNTKLSWLFLLTGCLKALLQDTPARSSGFQVQDNIPVIASMRKVAEQRSIKTALSYNVHNNNNNNNNNNNLSYDNMRKVAKQRSIKMALSYNVHNNNNEKH